MNPSSLTQDVQTIALNLMEGLDCPRSLTVAILIRHGEWIQLASLKADPLLYNTAQSYSNAAAATGFLKKYEALPTGIDTRAAALEKWWWAERECCKTNVRFSNFLEGHFGDLPERAIQLLLDVRKNCELILGPSPPPTFPGRFGPGATVSDMSRMSTIPDKMSSVPTYTPQGWHHLIPWTGTMWASASAALERSPQKVRGGVFFTVRKTAEIDRPCEKNPSINGFFQLGIGRVMRACLRSFGIDLQAGQEVHRRVACRSSKTGLSGTVDLTSASDCGAKKMVKFFLPPAWYSLLDGLRTHYTEVDGKQVHLEKFSAMGNGFTFELETTIFLAVSMACCPTHKVGTDILVYGDDIIAPSECIPLLLSVLRFCGFTPNEKKTFHEGMFRESCGGDYYGGEAVRPFQLKKEPRQPSDFIALANGIRRLALHNASPLARWSALRKTWFSVLDCIPSDVRICRGPEALGDIVIHDDPERWSTRWRSGIRYLACFRPWRYRQVLFKRFAYDVQAASAVYGVKWVSVSKLEDNTKYVVPRDGVLAHKRGWVPFS